MVHPHHDRNNVLQQGREEEHRGEPLPAPYPGKVIGGHNEPPYVVHGLDALSPILGAVSFPATREEVIARIGDALIPIDTVTTKRVADIIERTGAQSFRSSVELEQAAARVLADMQPHYEDGRGAHHWQRSNVTGRPPRG